MALFEYQNRTNFYEKVVTQVFTTQSKRARRSGLHISLLLKDNVAEEQGFEPWEDFHPRRFSRPVHSTTLPLLRQRRIMWFQ